MYQLRAAEDRGQTRLAWLDSRHTFSFGEYFDPRYLGVSALRVINDDTVRPGAGFDTHGHRDMEILTYVTEGVIAHRDSTGGREEVPAGEFQLMHAGKGIRHSEFNASPDSPLKFLQIWIQPDRLGGEPGYEQKRFPRVPGLQLVVSPDGAEGSLTVRQNARVYRVQLAAGEALALPLAATRIGYLHALRGRLSLDGHALAAGDGIALHGEQQPALAAGADSEALFFDLPPVTGGN
ncbi:MAG: pirin family protein [Gammaproteobacteria bacterium]